MTADDGKSKGVETALNPAAGGSAEQRSALTRSALSPAAQRALAEAAERRAAADAAVGAVKEEGGRAGPDPVRYGDWENGGIASDF